MNHGIYKLDDLSQAALASLWQPFHLPSSAKDWMDARLDDLRKALETQGVQYHDLPEFGKFKQQIDALVASGALLKLKTPDGDPAWYYPTTKAHEKGLI